MNTSAEFTLGVKLLRAMKTRQETVVLQARVPQLVVDLIDAEAKKTKSTRSDILRQALVEWLEFRAIQKAAL